MDKQYEQLSYDASKWEFPSDRLKLGKIPQFYFDVIFIPSLE